MMQKLTSILKAENNLITQMSRFYNNPFIDQPITFRSTDKAIEHIKPFSVDAIRRFTSHIKEEWRPACLRDLSIYTGTSGILLMGIRLQQNASLARECRLDRFVEMLRTILSETLRNRDYSKLFKNISVFTSNFTAPCLVGALWKEHAPTDSQFFDDFLNCSSFADNSMPNEALYGRVGYLAGLLALFDAGYKVPLHTVSKIVKRILKEGRRLRKEVSSSRSNGRSVYEEELTKSMVSPPPPPPLMFQWHDKFYLGSAHGFAGILSVLIKVHEKMPDALPVDSLETQVLPTVRWLADLQLASGNWPSSLGASLAGDRLVQWCHGAPGMIPLVLRAHELTGDGEYLRRAKHAAEVVWERGLLTKGCGLCHGSAGSGYALLSLYQHTGDLLYLERAVAIAQWCADYFNHAERTPDRPMSLFEGISGTIMYLIDILNPSTVSFPLLN